MHGAQTRKAKAWMQPLSPVLSACNAVVHACRGAFASKAGRDVARHAAAEVAEAKPSDTPSAAAQKIQQFEDAMSPAKQRAGASTVNSGIKLDKVRQRCDSTLILCSHTGSLAVWSAAAFLTEAR